MGGIWKVVCLCMEGVCGGYTEYRGWVAQGLPVHCKCMVGGWVVHEGWAGARGHMEGGFCMRGGQVAHTWRVGPCLAQHGWVAHGGWVLHLVSTWRLDPSLG